MSIKGYSARQCTVAAPLEFSGLGVHSGRPATLRILPADPETGIRVARTRSEGELAGPVSAHYSRVARTTLCTTLDLGESVSVATIEHVAAALSGLGVDNALVVVDGPEVPIVDGSALPFAEALIDVGLSVQPAFRRFIRIKRAVTVRNNDAFAALEPYNGRALDIEIDFDNAVIGRQRMIFDWTPRRFFEDVAPARTFGFVKDAKVLRQAGFALGSSLENSIAVEEAGILNRDGLRFEDEFVRHKLLDAIGDLALAGLPIYGRFRSYKGGHAINALVLGGLFASPQNYEILTADELPFPFAALDDMPSGMMAEAFLRSVG